MSPEGMALALLLHALAAFFLWWMSQHRPAIPLAEDVVEVSFEAPKPPEPPPPPPAPTPAPTPAPAPPIEGIRPPAEITSENPTQVRPTAENPSNRNVPLPPAQSLEKAIPKPEPEPAPPSSQAFAQPKPEPKPEPTKPEPKPEPPKPQQHAAIAVPPANPNPRPPPPPQPRPTPPQLAPSPLSRIPQTQ